MFGIILTIFSSLFKLSAINFVDFPAAIDIRILFFPETLPAISFKTEAKTFGLTARTI